MAFKQKWFSNKIVSSEGYYIRTVGRAAILYEDDTHKVYVSAEGLATRSPAWALYPNDMRMDSEAGPKLTGDRLRSLIVERIEAAFAFLGWRLDIS